MRRISALLLLPLLLALPSRAQHPHEYGSRITGWKPLQHGSANTWRVNATGLHQTASSGRHSIVKGDPLTAYEFSTQVYGDVHAPSSGGVRERRMGFLPVYVDSKNWLRAEIDMNSHQLVVERMRNGKRNGYWTVDLTRTKHLHPDATYSDPFAKRYTFRSPTLIYGLRMRRKGQQDGRPIPASWTATYRRDGDWKPLPSGTSFDPILADALRLEIGEDGDEVGALSVHVLGKSTYNLRTVKLPGEVIIFVDGKEVLRVPGGWPPSRVGLTTRNMEATYDGLLRFDISPADPGRGAR